MPIKIVYSLIICILLFTNNLYGSERVFVQGTNITIIPPSEFTPAQKLDRYALLVKISKY
jgi:hypothetical protein